MESTKNQLSNIDTNKGIIVIVLIFRTNDLKTSQRQFNARHPMGKIELATLKTSFKNQTTHKLTA